MGLRIGNQDVGGLKIGTEIVGGMKIGNAVVYRKRSTTPVDRPGTLSITVNALNRGVQVGFILTDPDGISRVTSNTRMATDGSIVNNSFTVERVDANTFRSNTTLLRNVRWRNASISVTYVETGGTERTLTQSYSV